MDAKMCKKNLHKGSLFFNRIILCNSSRKLHTIFIDFCVNSLLKSFNAALSNERIYATSAFFTFVPLFLSINKEKVKKNFIGFDFHLHNSRLCCVVFCNSKKYSSEQCMQKKQKADKRGWFSVDLYIFYRNTRKILSFSEVFKFFYFFNTIQQIERLNF